MAKNYPSKTVQNYKDYLKDVSKIQALVFDVYIYIYKFQNIK